MHVDTKSGTFRPLSQNSETAINCYGSTVAYAVSTLNSEVSQQLDLFRALIDASNLY